ncbi:MAG: cation transporter [Coriobacteriales bacterium]|nr:cation transporter [Coriobacteriales bacterium]
MTDWLLHRFVANADDVKNPQVRGAVGRFASITCIIFNVLLCAGKMLIGLLAGSISIIADAVNNLTDAASNIISLFGFKLANKPADADHPFGHGRYEYLSGLIVAVLVLVIGVELLKGSVERIINPSPVEFSWALVAVLVLAIVVKLWMAGFNKKLGERIDSTTLIATGIDSRNDVISTAAVLLAALISHFVGVELDAWMGLAVAAFILYSGVGLVRETLDPLLGSTPSPELVKHIEETVMGFDGILGIHDLLVHDYGPGRIFASVHAEVPAEMPILESHDVIDQAEAKLRKEGLEVTIHLDPVVTSDPRVAHMREWVAQVVKGIDPAMTIHDFRMVPGDSHTNLIFDVVQPYSCTMSERELRKRIADTVEAEFPHHYCVIHVDKNYVG